MNHISKGDLERVRGGEARPDEAVAIGRHVAECTVCATLAGEVLDLGGAAAALAAAFTIEEADDHPDADCLVAFAGGTLSDAGARREIAEHVRKCSECVDDVNDLRRIAVRRRRPFIWWLPAVAALITVVMLLPARQQNRVELQEIRPSTGTMAPPRALETPPSSAPTRPAEWDALVANVRRTGVLPFPSDIRNFATPDAFRGAPAGVEDGELSPVATAVEDVRPELRWPAYEGARYHVSVSAAGVDAIRSDALTDTRWRMPEPLQRGRTYRWQVTVVRGQESLVLPAPPAPPAIFRIVTSREHEELKRARALAADDHLLLGLLYARVGVVAEARREILEHQLTTRDELAAPLLRQLPGAD
jgi:hypothetical protein